MRIDWWTLGLQTVNALVLIWLLSRFLFRPVADVIAQRKAAAAQLLRQAEEAKAAAQAGEAKAQAALAEIADGREASLAAIVAEAQTERLALLASARADADRIRETARSEIERDAKRERDARLAGASALALDIARRLVDRFPPSARIAGFIDGLSGAVSAAPPETRADFDRDGVVRLKAPRALTPEEEEACQRALERAFGRPLAFVVEIDPDVIAGLELENTHATIRNSLRADLTRIAAAIEKHDAHDAG